MTHRQADETSTDRAHREASTTSGKSPAEEPHRPNSGRRGFLRAIGGVAAVGAIAGCLDGIGGATDDGDYPDSFDDDGNPEYGDWFDDVDAYDETVDVRDETGVGVAVGASGGLSFDPPAVLIEPGTTVTWEWTGDGGQHDVVHVDGAFESDLVREAGHTFEHAFDEPGVYRYVCAPHRGAGMKGAVAVPDAGNGESETASSHHRFQ